jgi:nickel-dependent lactate racemase
MSTKDARPLVPIDPPLSTAAWYGDRLLTIGLPSTWDLTVHWPRTPNELSDAEIRAAILEPVGGNRISTLVTPGSRVSIVVDDLTRPTPVDRILPHVIEELTRAGVADRDVTIVVGTGTHRRSHADAVTKVGAAAAARFAVAFHDDLHDCVKVGTTSFGSPVLANRTVVAADLVIGLGGVYPQHTVGLGGGAKTILGVLGRSSIERLHYRHQGVGGRLETTNDFRRDVAEMASMVGMKVAVGAMVDARRRIVWLQSGDPANWFPNAREAALRMFSAPLPGAASVVIANSYPMDLSATFVRSKGIIPLTHAAVGASRVLIGAASEGIGYHGLYPLEVGRLGAARHVMRVVRNVPRRAVPGLVVRGLARTAKRALRPTAGAVAANADRRQIIFHPTAAPSNLPPTISGMATVPDWGTVIRMVEAQQGSDQLIRAVVYPCSPLQVLEG